MRKSFSFLLAIGVCALMQITVAAQSADLDSVVSPETVKTTEISSPNDAPALSGADLRTRMTEAKQLLKSRADLSGGKTVTLAALDPGTSELHLLTIDKDLFLTKDASLLITSQRGLEVRLTVVRANGVNTAVTVKALSTGRELTPLMVAYPIVRSGSITEIAYYASAHPALLSSDTSSAGESYVTTTLDTAARNLSDKGVNIPSDIVDIAEHLCVVEHTDHKRFITEKHSELFPEILSLYALNQGNTYRYSVSTAGAGGMIQMIPRTYEGIRQQHPAVPLQADFVSGMRDHANALQAMLLYMNDTWNKLEESSEVQDALRSGTATKPELLAAGYNSNPLRLPQYLRNGGADWRTLIPAETQMYLAIYSEVDRNIKFNAPANAGLLRDNSSSADFGTAIADARGTGRFMSWLTQQFVSGGSAMIDLFR